LELINEVKVTHRDSDNLDEIVKLQTNIRHFPISATVEEPERVVEEITEAVLKTHEHWSQEALELIRKKDAEIRVNDER
jgi:hypothetical protein